MHKTVEVRFKTNDISEVRDKINAFETLYDVEPDVFVGGELYEHKDEYGRFDVMGNLEVRDVRYKYFSAMVDGELSEELEPTTDSLLSSNHFEREAEPTRWKLEARIEL